MVPLGRYFLWVGSVLLAMFFIADRVWPTAAPAPVNEVVAAQAPTDPGNSMILRIQSARKWPDKIVFDTSIPTMVPPPVVAVIAAPAEPVVAPSAAAASPLEARAEMKQAVPPVSPPPKRLAKVHRRNAQAGRLNRGVGLSVELSLRVWASRISGGARLVVPLVVTCPQAWPGN